MYVVWDLLLFIMRFHLLFVHLVDGGSLALLDGNHVWYGNYGVQIVLGTIKGRTSVF